MIFESKAVPMKAVPAMSAGLAALAAVALVPTPALAACTQDDTTVTCSGDLSAVTSGLIYSTNDGVDALIIEDLNSDYELDGGLVVISLTGAGDDGSDDGDDGSAGDDTTITYDAGDYGFYGYGTAVGIEVSSQGGDGAAGRDDENAGTGTGGRGGTGGNGGAATLTMTSGFFEREDGTTGLSVSSTGGAGGDGGEAALSESGGDIYSGGGGDGGAGGAATITIEGLSDPDGDAGITMSEVDTGIVVSSTGGAGGQGGEAKCDHDGCKGYSGEGGQGGAGGTTALSVADTDISITDFSSTGIAVISTGGTGGKGGLGLLINTNTYLINDGNKGRGGDGGDGGTAAYVLNGAAVTASDSSGDASYAVEVTSAGGDGGDGNDNDAQANGVGSDSFSYVSGFGNGGDGGNGNMASLTLTDSDLAASVTKDGAVAVWLGSTGGDGGTYGSTNSLNNTLWSPTSDKEDITANGGDGGDGGVVSGTVDSDSTITVSTSGNGNGSGALTLMSAGGDGGDGANGSTSAFYGEDSSGGDGGNGGRVTGNMTTVEATTSGDDAYGIFVASLGGDGGIADSGDGDGGNSNPIDILFSAATVQTTGEGSHGIYALSQGGDGGNSSSGGDGGDADWIILHAIDGTVNATGDDAYGIAAASVAGSAGSGDSGDSNYVTLTVGADVTVSGSDSAAIYAESTGGSSSGDVEVTVDSGATIAASGKDSYGIHALSAAESAGDVTVTSAAAITVSGTSDYGIYVQSDGDTSDGDLSVTIGSAGSVTAVGNYSNAVVFDGDGTNKLINNGTLTATTGSHTVTFDGDGDNSITNNGTLATDDLTSASKYALYSYSSGVDVTNNGIFGGTVYVAGGDSSNFTNNSGATLNLGPDFNIGTDGTITNDGTLSPGGSGSVLTSLVEGVLTQSSTGTYLVDLDGSSADQIEFLSPGTTLNGTVSVNIISLSGSSGSADIAVSDNGDIASGLTVADTAAADFSVTTGSAETVTLSWNIDADNEDLLGSANSNQREIASYLQQVLQNGGFGKELASLLNIVDEGNYIKALDSFASQIASDNQLTSLFSAQGFSDALLSCSKRDGAYRFVDQDRCAWLRAGASGMERSASAENRPFDQSAWQLAGGGQVEVRDDWFLGSGFSIGTQSLSVDDIAKSDGNFYQGGVVAKHTMGNSILSASLTAGYGDYDITRYLFSTDIAKGNETLWTVSGQLSASHAFVKGDWYLKPRFDVAFDHVNMNSFTETGAGGASLTVDGNAQTYYSLQPAIEFGGEVKAANGVLLRPSLSVGLTQFLGDAAPATSASFADTPDGVAPFTIASEFDKTYVDVKAGLEILTTANVSLSAQGFGQFSDNISSYGGSAKLAVRF